MGKHKVLPQTLQTHPIKTTGGDKPWENPNNTIVNTKPMQLAELTDGMMLNKRITELLNTNHPMFKAASD